MAVLAKQQIRKSSITTQFWTEYRVPDGSYWGTGADD